VGGKELAGKGERGEEGKGRGGGGKPTSSRRPTVNHLSTPRRPSVAVALTQSQIYTGAGPGFWFGRGTGRGFGDGSPPAGSKGRAPVGVWGEASRTPKNVTL